MSFAGKVWRLLVGIKDALSLVFLLIFFSLIFAALSVRPNPGVVREGALLLDLDGSVVEERSAIDPLEALLAGALPTREYEVRDLVHAIDEAARDERIEALALDLTTFLGGGPVHMQSIGEALDRFRAADKPIFAYAVAYTDDSLMLAAHSTEIWVDPMGGAVVRGPGGQSLFYGALLERFDINAHVFRVGTFKSAVEPYTQNEFSPEAEENLQAIYASLWEEWRANVTQARPQADLDRATGDLTGLVAEANGDFAQAALEAGLADRIGTYEEWGDRVAEVVGSDEWDDTPGAFAATELDPWLAEIAPPERTRSLTGGKSQIGVITVAGEISDGRAGPGEAGAQRITEQLDDALDDDLAALVVRINSPGGTVSGSEAIRRAILRHKANGTPVAVSMGNYAASGGYWIATPADRIFAEPETLTGSIGVFLVVPTFEDLLAEYGVTSDGVTTTPLTGQPDLLGGLSPETEALMQAETNAVYRRFLDLVAQSRGIDMARADELGQGRVWTGGTARQLGLVDQFGDLDAALAWAAQAAGLEEDEWEPRFLAGEIDPFAAMIGELLGGAQSPPPAAGVSGLFVQREQDVAAGILAELEVLLGHRGIQARCLECLPAGSFRSRAASREANWLGHLAARIFAN